MAQRAQRGETGKLAIGFGTTAGVTVLPKMIRRFRKLYPWPELMLRELFGEAQLSGLRSGELDVAFGYTSINEQEFSVRRLKQEPLYAVIPGNHRMARLKTVGLADLSTEKIIIPRRDVAGVVLEEVLAACAAARIEPKLSYEVETPHAAFALVSAGLGISIAPASACTLHREGVAVRPIRDLKAKVQLRMFWRNNNQSPVLHQFLKC